MADTPRPDHVDRGADHRAHGTHGKGDSREEYLDDRKVEPGNARAAQAGEANPQKLADTLTGELGDAGWGSAAAGDSSIDTRSPKKPRENASGDSQNDRGGTSARRDGE
jgi:hypothetical protein